MPADRVELGVELLANLEADRVSIAEAIDRIETITENPTIQRRILDRAEERGVIERDEGAIRPTAHAFVRFGADVTTKEGEFSCRRCGADLRTGYFISFESGELGPFGSSCIRKVTGRE